LGKDHSLFPLVTLLRTDIAGVNTALDAYKMAVTDLTHAQVEEETAKANLRQQYEFNYLDGRKELGVKLVERIFPVLVVREKDTESSKTTTKSSVA
jgi:hypothetical protein